MKPLQLLAILTTFFLCLAGLAWLFRVMSPENAPPQVTAPTEAAEDPEQEPENPDKDHYTKNPFKISKGGEQPHAELVETKYQFGRMGLGKVGKHDFIVKNTGTAPLKIARGPTQCKCTVTGLKDQEVPPGGEASIHLAWEPKSDGPFAQNATIWTNDPEHPELTIGVEGEMFHEIDVQPSEGWKLNNLTTSEPTTFRGAIKSPVFEKFEITKIETSSDRVKVEFAPMTEEELRGPNYNSLSGFMLNGELAGISEPGKVDETVTIYTDLPDYPKFELPVTATRIGAITIIGPHWFAGGPMMDLGKVSAEKGKEFKFTVMVPPGEEEFKFTEVVNDPGFVTLRLQPEKTGKELSRERYTMFVTIPPGSPKGIWGPGREGKISIKTNHPQIPELNIRLNMDVE
ncbi:DUF1573 domain-containing protein [Planctomicrobium sp. SH661]|uniref:DUF1573 domain-containing protein n=1 Tax=Planctomicrobium sp. SH661 TaxID=3448124 RepID=UPI003F5BF098